MPATHNRKKTTTSDASLRLHLVRIAETFGILADNLPGAARGAEPERGAHLVIDALGDLRPALRVLKSHMEEPVRPKAKDAKKRQALRRCLNHLEHCLNLARIAEASNPNRSAEYLLGGISDLRAELEQLGGGHRRVARAG